MIRIGTDIETTTYEPAPARTVPADSPTSHAATVTPSPLKIMKGYYRTEGTDCDGFKGAR